MRKWKCVKSWYRPEAFVGNIVGEAIYFRLPVEAQKYFEEVIEKPTKAKVNVTPVAIADVKSEPVKSTDTSTDTSTEKSTPSVDTSSLRRVETATTKLKDTSGSR